MKVNKINKEKIIELIKEEAYIIKRKRQLYETVQNIEKELKILNERMGIVGTFGFSNPQDSINKSKTGFVNPVNISYIEQLAKDFGVDYKDEMEKYHASEKLMSEMQRENDNLKKQIKELSESKIPSTTTNNTKK